MPTTRIRTVKGAKVKYSVSLSHVLHSEYLAATLCRRLTQIFRLTTVGRSGLAPQRSLLIVGVVTGLAGVGYGLPYNFGVTSLLVSDGS